MRQGRSIAVITATIEYKDGRVSYKTFRSDKSLARLRQSIRRMLKADPTVAHVGLGNGIYLNYYGAH